MKLQRVGAVIFASFSSVTVASASNADAVSESIVEHSKAIERNTEALRKNVTLGESGVSSTPQWDLLGDASVTTLDASKPSTALGVQYVSPWTLLRVFVRKNLANSTVNAPLNDPTFGHAVLSPGLANVSIQLRVESSFDPMFAPHIKCNENQNCVNGSTIIVRYGPRAYVDVSMGSATFAVTPPADTPAGAPAPHGISGIPFAASAGLMYKVDGAMPGGAKFGSNKLMVAPYIGGAIRSLGGDFGDAERRALWGSNASTFAGGELGCFFQFGSILIDGHLTLLGATNDTGLRVAGLTGSQFQMKLTFLLPWSVLGDTASEQRQHEADAAKIQ